MDGNPNRGITKNDKILDLRNGITCRRGNENTSRDNVYEFGREPSYNYKIDVALSEWFLWKLWQRRKTWTTLWLCF